jgi:hypothetical protein
MQLLLALVAQAVQVMAGLHHLDQFLYLAHLQLLVVAAAETKVVQGHLAVLVVAAAELLLL